MGRRMSYGRSSIAEAEGVAMGMAMAMAMACRDVGWCEDVARTLRGRCETGETAAGVRVQRRTLGRWDGDVLYLAVRQRHFCRRIYIYYRSRTARTLHGWVLDGDSLGKAAPILRRWHLITAECPHLLSSLTPALINKQSTAMHQLHHFHQS